MEKKKVSVKEYAKLCEVSPKTIYNRIESGEIIPLSVKSGFAIDLTTTPVKKAKDRGRRTIDSYLD